VIILKRFSIFAIAACLQAQDPVSVLKQNCVSCHGVAKVSGLDLRTREAMLAGGERGPALDPGHSEKSRLYRFAAGLDKPQMPPGKTLTDGELKVLRQWIDTGAPMEAAKPEPSESA
jgi:mono/diheme cytochrome c family protein